MLGTVDVQHAPRGDASYSRREGVRWTRTLRRTRQSLRSTLTRIGTSSRVIDAAERFAPSRPAAAARQLVQATAWLCEAATYLSRTARGLEATTGSIAVEGAAADTSDLNVHWVLTAGLLVEVSRQLDASFARLSPNIVAGVIGRLPAAMVAWSRVAQNGRGEPSVIIIENRAASGALAAARNISRGRAPPFVSTCAF